MLAEIGFLRLVASSSASSTMSTSSFTSSDHNDNDIGDGVRHIVAVVEMLTDSAIPMLLMRKEPWTLRSIQEESASTSPAQVVK